MDLRISSRISSRLLRVAGAAACVGLSGWVIVGQPATSAFADSQPYELFCPGTPVGNIALNGVVTTATITPASPAAGSQFQVTNYQTQLTIPSAIVGAAAALGNTAITGSATATINATGATPASLKSPTLQINTPIPSPVPAAGLQLMLPSPAGSIGPFTASGGPITLTEDKSAALTLVVSGNNLNLTCTSYPNNTVPQSGITTSTPSGSPLSPQIATASAGSGGGGATTTAPAATPTTAPPTAAGGNSLANTGAGPGVFLMAEVGLAVLALAGLLTLSTRLRWVPALLVRARRRTGG